MQGFVLPHRSKLTAREHERAGGPGGWNARQGFYVYRNDRLVVAGSWLGMGAGRPWTREEHYKLARLSVDIPNTMDLAWHLDVKKSDARPPAEAMDTLKRLATLTRAKAVLVFRTRGDKSVDDDDAGSPKTDLPAVWRGVEASGHPVYKISRAHPLLRHLRSTLAPREKKAFEALLRLLEETVPIHRIWIDMSEAPDSHAAPFDLSDEKDVAAVMLELQKALMDVDDLTSEEAARHLAASGLFRAILGSGDPGEV